jgi:hypothetical protein
VTRCLVLLAALGLATSFPSALAAGDVPWQRIKIDDTFRSEGVAAFDVNKDGRVDVVAGDVWYEAPDWKLHEIRTPGKFIAGQGYSNSFLNFGYDINGDGWTDLIYIGFPGDPFSWYENPQNAPGHWKEHPIWHSACNESPNFLDVTGDGRPDLLLGSQPESQMGFLPVPPAAQSGARWTFYPVSQPGDPNTNGTFKYYHGLGVGDFNRDGRQDVLIRHGWWEAPAERTKGPWAFHPFKLVASEPGPLDCAHIHLEDLDLDGDEDLLCSSAHSYGVWWWENVDGTTLKQHVIDKTFSQTHALWFIDVNGDGQRDLVTGKRYFAHNGHDPGAHEPVLMVWYEVKRAKGAPPQFIRHEIEAGRDTGVGTQFQVSDVNGDGRPDIVLSNKKGVNLLLQKP